MGILLFNDSKQVSSKESIQVNQLHKMNQNSECYYFQAFSEICSIGGQKEVILTNGQFSWLLTL